MLGGGSPQRHAELYRKSFALLGASGAGQGSPVTTWTREGLSIIGICGAAFPQGFWKQ